MTVADILPRVVERRHDQDRASCSARTASTATCARSGSASRPRCGLPGEAGGLAHAALALQRHQHGLDADRQRHRGHRDADARRLHDHRQRRGRPAAADRRRDRRCRRRSATTSRCCRRTKWCRPTPRPRSPACCRRRVAAAPASRPQVAGYTVAGKTGHRAQAAVHAAAVHGVVRRVRAGRVAPARGDRRARRAAGRAATSAATSRRRRSRRSCRRPFGWSGYRPPHLRQRRREPCRLLMTPGTLTPDPTWPIRDGRIERRGRARVRWHDLLAGLDVRERVRDVDVEVTSITEDSRRVAPGACFAARTGGAFDGHDHAARRGRRRRGRAARRARRSPLDVPQARVDSVLRALGPAAARLYGDPSRAVRCLGVTGTAGKTTTTMLLASIARAAGETPGLIGSDGVFVGDERLGVETSTPDHAAGRPAPGAARADARPRRRHRRDGSHVARARPASRRRHVVRGGVLHQPESRAPRRPRLDGRVLRGQARALRPRARRRQSRRTSTIRTASRVRDHARDAGLDVWTYARATTPTPTSVRPTSC